MSELRYTIKSRDHGEKTFTMNSNGGYVRCNGKQICYGGRFTGCAVYLNGYENEVTNVKLEQALIITAQKWWRTHRRLNGCY